MTMLVSSEKKSLHLQKTLQEQIHQSLLEYSTATTTQAITETLRIINIDIKYYIAKRFSQVQQPVESDLDKYKDEFNNPGTAQAKSMVNKKPRFFSSTISLYYQILQSRIVFNPPLETQSETPRTPGNPHPWNQHSWTKSLGEYGSLFENLTSTLNKTDRNTLTWEPPPTQPLTKSSTTPSKETAILQSIEKINKGKQPELALGEHSSM
ncbi:hypothetical protein G9A89_007625 [Geosiphon pyriformis]|nr:hypothetical protein G9A89_007625 [Geosiphon pyriformis]